MGNPVLFQVTNKIKRNISHCFKGNVLYSIQCMTKMWKSKNEHIIFDGRCTTYMLTNLLHTLFLLPLCKLTLSLSFIQTRIGNIDGIHLVDKSICF